MESNSKSIPDVSVVIVSYNTRQLTIECVQSILDQAQSASVEVIVADNASSDGSAEALRIAFPNITVVANERNLGFAGANNVGIRLATGRYVLLLNPDTLILDHAIDRMVDYMDARPDIGCAGCQVWFDETSMQRTCFRFPSPTALFLAYAGLQGAFPDSRWLCGQWMPDWDRRSERDVDVVSGMFMFIRRETLEQVGLMDDDYFIYAEEADWCYRAWKKGWRCTFTPIAKIVHREGGGKSTTQVRKRMYVQMQKSLLLFHRKNLGLLSFLRAKAIVSVLMVIRLVGSTLLRFSPKRDRAAAVHAHSWAALKYQLLGSMPA